MGFLDTIKKMVGGVQSKLPENLNSADELKAKAQELAGQHGDTIHKAVDGIQSRVSNDSINKSVDGAQERFNDFSSKK